MIQKRFVLLFIVTFNLCVSASIFDEGMPGKKVQKESETSEPKVEASQEETPKVNSPAPDNEENKPKKPTKKKKKLAQWGYVKSDNAVVYQFPNFDSPIIESFPYKKKVRVSTRVYRGIGGLGAFYKVRIKRKVFGYVTDVDVSLVPIEQLEKQQQGNEAPVDENNVWGSAQFDESDTPPPQSFFLTSYAGLGFSKLNYSEKVNNNTELGSISVLGLNYSGPTPLMGGFPLDIDVYFSAEAPSFYSNYFTSISGFMIHASGSIMVPAVEQKNWIVYYLGGVTLIYTSYAVIPNTTPSAPSIDSSELKMGPLAGLGGAMRFGERTVVRGSVKYYYEKESYLGFGASVQYRF